MFYFVANIRYLIQFYCVKTYVLLLFCTPGIQTNVIYCILKLVKALPGIFMPMYGRHVLPSAFYEVFIIYINIYFVG